MYKLTTNDGIFKRLADSAYIPFDQGNRDYVDYLAWIADGGVPEPADAVPEPTLQQRIDAECQKYGIANEITLEGLMAGLLAGALVTGMTEAQLEQANPAFNMGKQLRALFVTWRAAQP